MKSRIAILFVLSAFMFGAGASAFAQQAPEIPSLSADLGPCSAEFTVLDAAGKPVYEARVHTLVRSGAFGLKKMDLDLRTNSDGKAKITKLPEVPKRPIVFEVSKGQLIQTLRFDPASGCHAVYKVELK